MAKFNKGDKVIRISNNMHGIIVEVLPPRRGQYLYRVQFGDEETDVKSTDLAPNVDMTNEFERLLHNYFDTYTEYLRDNTLFKILSSNNSTLSSLKASRTVFKPYQFKPLLKYLNSGINRLLIADEVGLGKTIEAGHIMLELKARGELHNVLVVCPMSLKNKWADELQLRFGLDFVAIEDKRQLIDELKHHNGHVKAVVNYDKMRIDSDVLNYILEKNIKFSLVVCDESHKLRNRGTLVYEGAEQLLKQANGVVFMSATPIMIDESNLFNQLRLLDEDTYDNQEVFVNTLELNKPFVKALSLIKNLKMPLPEIANILDESEFRTINTVNEELSEKDFVVKDYFRDFPLYQRITKSMREQKDTPALRADLQHDLSDMSPMNNIFSRSRKRDVTKDWTQAERHAITEEIAMTADEEAQYDQLIDEYEYSHGYEDEYGRFQTHSMGMVTLKRQLASSVWACSNDIENLKQGQDLFSEEKDAKFDALLKTIETVFAHGQKKIIVFAIFKKTLLYLKIRLKKAGYNCEIIYGDSSIDKWKCLKNFEDNEDIQVLLSSEVGSEGLDMQFCNSMVNYDLPWNPMVVEQRIGRIDRVGQLSKVLNIYTMVVKNSILETIYVRLLKRIGIFRESIGDLEEILDPEAIMDLEVTIDGKKSTIKDQIKSIERDFYSDKLTEAEIKRKEIEIEQAIANERVNLKEIEEGLSSTLTNDSYFQNEINRIDTNNAYVTEKELITFVKQIIKEFLTTCSLETTDDADVYGIRVPKSSPRTLRRFLEEFTPADDDNKALFRHYIDEIDDSTSVKITFNQQKAFRDKSLSFVNLYHPIVQAGVRMFNQKLGKYHNTFFFGMTNKNVQGIEKGLYVLAVYRIATSRKLLGRDTLTESLYPVLFDIKNDRIIDDRELTEKFMGRAQSDGVFTPQEEWMRLSEEQVGNIRFDLNDVISEYLKKYKEDIQIRIENQQKMRYEQTRQFYALREERLQELIKRQEDNIEFVTMTGSADDLHKLQTTIRLNKARYASEKAKHEEDLQKILCDPMLTVKENIKSLNLINVI